MPAFVTDPWYRLAGLLAVVGLTTRGWLTAGQAPHVWQDTDDYLDVAAHSWLSADLWAGDRVAGPAVLLKLVGGNLDHYVLAQMLIATACWTALAVMAARAMPTRRLQRTVACVVVGVSLASPITMWEPSVLSESLAISLLAAVAAALLWAAERPGLSSSILLLVALAAWSLIRDAHAAVLIFAGVALVAGWLIVRGRRWPSPQALAVTGIVLLLGAAGVAASDHGGRGDFPLRNVYQVRILPYPDRVEWFSERGMPQAEAFLPGGTHPAIHTDGYAPVTHAAPEDPTLSEWSSWFEADGQWMFARYVLAHPTYLLTEPLASPERTFNNADGDRSFYTPPDQRSLPLLGDLPVPSRPLATGLAVGAIVWGLTGRPRASVLRSRLWVTGAGLSALALPHAALAWHADGMETARHLVVPVAQLHVGTLLLLAGVVAVARPGAVVGSGSGADGQAVDEADLVGADRGDRGAGDDDTDEVERVGGVHGDSFARGR